MTRIDASAAAFILFAAATAPSEAAEWVEVGIASNGVRAFVDTDSIVPSKDTVKVLQRFVLPRPLARRVTYVDQRVIYNCTSVTARTLSSLEFDAAGRLLREGGTREHPVYNVGAGTLPRYIFDALC